MIEERIYIAIRVSKTMMENNSLGHEYKIEVLRLMTGYTLFLPVERKDMRKADALLHTDKCRAFRVLGGGVVLHSNRCYELVSAMDKTIKPDLSYAAKPLAKPTKQSLLVVIRNHTPRTLRERTKLEKNYSSPSEGRLPYTDHRDDIIC